MTLVEGVTPAIDNKPARFPNSSSHHSSPNVSPANERAGKKREDNRELIVSGGHLEMPSANTFATPWSTYAQLPNTIQRSFLSSQKCLIISCSALRSRFPRTCSPMSSSTGYRRASQRARPQCLSGPTSALTTSQMCCHHHCQLNSHPQFI